MDVEVGEGSDVVTNEGERHDDQRFLRQLLSFEEAERRDGREAHPGDERVNAHERRWEVELKCLEDHLVYDDDRGDGVSADATS